jgi:hypothetical protein
MIFRLRTDSIWPIRLRIPRRLLHFVSPATDPRVEIPCFRFCHRHSVCLNLLVVFCKRCIVFAIGANTRAEAKLLNFFSLTSFGPALPLRKVSTKSRPLPRTLTTTQNRTQGTLVPFLIGVNTWGPLQTALTNRGEEIEELGNP